MEEKTICAVATPLGSSAVGIIRISGKNSLDIAKKYFKNVDYSKIEPRYMYLGNFCYEEITEKCLMVYFKSPFSYTGEDIVEFQIHGGEFVVNKILKVILKDCELAEAGEFTKRAFFNGKVSLNEAEGIIDVINAESEAELFSAYSLSDGKFNRKIIDFQNRLTEILAQVEVALDYPEHDDELITIDVAKKELDEINADVKELLNNSQSGAKIRSGINIAIVGSPNVGKSSLLNAILGKDRAIVSSIAGTTRDTLCETVVYKGIKLNFTDTAGIRENGDEIEKIGIQRAKKEIEKADIILFVADLERGISDEEKTFLNQLDKNKCIVVLNKQDKKKKDINIENAIEISALEEKNIDKIKEEIYNRAISNKIDFSNIVLTNVRHVEILEKIEEMINKAVEAGKEDTLDAFAFEIKQIWNQFGKITGTTENEEIINEIFSKFCLGK